MRYCTDPAHANPKCRQIPWILDGQPDHDHDEWLRFAEEEDAKWLET